MEVPVTATPTILGIGIALLCIAVFGYWWLDFSKQKHHETPPPVISSCPNPNCIRCQKYRQVQKSAKSRLPWISKDLARQFPNESLDRIQASIQNPQQSSSKVQAPTVLMVSGLKSEEVVTKLHSDTCRHLVLRKESTRTMILRELHEVPDALWNTNDSPKGPWRVLPLLNQGSWNQDICKKCPDLYDFIRGLPNLLDHCLFGNVIISKIYPGTIIEPHCGPTNVRHRLQYALEIPSSPRNIEDKDHHASSQLCLRVGTNTKIEWKEPGDVFVFDDSFVHSVTYNDNDNASNNDNNSMSSSSDGSQNYYYTRMVLIIDLWHPDLTPAERKLIQFLYPPFSVSR